MFIKQELGGNRIKLDNNQIYQITWIVNIEDKNYCYLININDLTEVIFCELIDKNSIKILDNKNELSNLIKIIGQEINTFIYS